MKFLELRREAEKWRKRGMVQTGTDQREDFEDALKLLRSAADNPIGNQDYAVWFEIGWLLWKKDEAFDEAKAAFHRSARLASASNDPYYPLALRHEAYMHYLLDDQEAAYMACKQAAAANDDAFVVFDLARYASKTRRDSEAAELLKSAVRKTPHLIVTMFSEIDWQRPGSGGNSLSRVRPEF